MLDRIRKTFKPEIFQGSLDRDRYFEGWYFKLVDREERHRLALIPGISLDRAGGTSHAFVQVIDGNTAATSYFEYPLDEFEADEAELLVRIGPSTFSSSGLSLDLGEGEGALRGELSYSRLVRWPTRLLAPGVMGWYSFVPRMECYHGLVSLDHEIAGSLELGETVDFTGGRGYIEKDWGTSFPSAYVWMQSNHFGAPGVSVMASIARIPWIGRSFTGFLATVLHDGELLPFATYTGAKLEELEIAEKRVGFTLRDKRHRLEVEAFRGGSPSSPDEGFGLLKSPDGGSMKGRIAETLTAEVHMRLFERRRLGGGDRLVFEGTGTSAGLEIEATTADLQP